LVLAASIPFAIILAATFSGLMVRGILPGPLIALVYLVIVLAMAFELSVDLIRSKQLSRGLQESEERMRLAARAADIGFWDWDVMGKEVWVKDIGKEASETFESGYTSLEHYLSRVHPDDRGESKPGSGPGRNCLHSRCGKVTVWCYVSSDQLYSRSVPTSSSR
jgi:PAS domain-containing protein